MAPEIRVYATQASLASTEKSRGCDCVPMIGEIYQASTYGLKSAIFSAIIKSTPDHHVGEAWGAGNPAEILNLICLIV